MTIGSFFIVLDENAQVLKRAIYLNDGENTIVIGDNELLRIRMGHSDKKFVLTILPEVQIYSFKKELKIKRNIFSLIGGTVLGKEDNPSTYKDAIQKLVSTLEEYEDKSNDEILVQLTLLHSELFSEAQIIFDQKELERHISNKIKELNKKGKFDEANDLLEKMKKIPKKLNKAHNEAEKFWKRDEFEKAEKEFENAKRFAESLGEKDLIKMYNDRIHLAKKVPSLKNKQATLLNKALEGLRSDNFAQAQKYFKQASEVSEELLDSLHAEEYALKAKALAEYVKIDSKFQKK